MIDSYMNRERFHDLYMIQRRQKMKYYKYKKMHKNETFEDFKERRKKCNKRRRIREKGGTE